MRNTLRVLNQMEADGLIRRYSIGGSIAALFYMEPFETEDLDILVLLPEKESRRLDPLSPLYECLRRQGFAEDGPYILICGVPVQFLIAYNALTQEAVEQSREVDYEDIPTRVPTPEHLAAILVDTGRSKDRARLAGLREQADLDENGLADILERHGLKERFKQWTTT